MPYAETIKIMHPDRLLSYDETNISLDQTRGSGRSRTVIAAPEDNGDVCATMSSIDITAVLGRVGLFALPPLASC